MPIRAPLGLLSVASILFFGLYLSISFGVSGHANIAAYSSGIFEMDVDRVVYDWASEEGALRSAVHPLSKLVIAPPLAGIRSLGAPFAAALFPIRIMIALSMTLNAILCGLLAWQLTRSSTTACGLGVLLCGVSFSSILLGSIPETASLSALSTVIPLLYLNTRIGKAFSWRESICWGFLGVFCVSFTITQIVHWLIALGVRARLSGVELDEDGDRLHSPRSGGKNAVRKAALLIVIFLVTLSGAAGLQNHLYPGTTAFPSDADLQHESLYMNWRRIEDAPLQHATSVLRQLLVFSLAAPNPAITNSLHLMKEHPWWALSLEDSRIREWSPLQWILIPGVALALLPGLIGLRSAHRRFIAPGLCIASQLGLHFLYGREFILYSGNWLGVWVAIMVAATWNRFAKHRRVILAAGLGLGIALAANNVMVMQRVYDEVESGLEAELRDFDGKLLPEAERTIQPRGSLRAHAPSRRQEAR